LLAMPVEPLNNQRKNTHCNQSGFSRGDERC
jgi:hypothetical protein